MTDIILSHMKETEGKNFLVFRAIESKREVLENENVNGYFIDAEENEIRRIIESVKAKEKNKPTGKKMLIAVLGRDDSFNRRVVETCKINYLVSPEAFWNDKNDSLKQRDSGFNHIVAKEAAKKDIAIIVDFSLFNSLENKKQKAIILGRIMQNIKVCRKARCKIKIATFAQKKEQLRDERELKAFLFTLGASSQQVNDSCKF